MPTMVCAWIWKSRKIRTAEIVLNNASLHVNRETVYTLSHQQRACSQLEKCAATKREEDIPCTQLFVSNAVMNPTRRSCKPGRNVSWSKTHADRLMHRGKFLRSAHKTGAPTKLPHQKSAATDLRRS